MAIKITKEDKILREILKIKRQKPNGMLECARCHKEYDPSDCQGLHVSHYWGRAIWTTRLLEENVDFHCHGCHSYLEGRPHEFKEWKMAQMGEGAYNQLLILAKGTFHDVYGMKKKFWVEDWYASAKDELKQLKNTQ